MNNQEKINLLQIVLRNIELNPASTVYEAMERMGDIVYNYCDYLTSESIDCDKELKRLPDADYKLSCAMLTMLLRKDHFSTDAFKERCQKGQPQKVIMHMIYLLQNEHDI